MKKLLSAGGYAALAFFAGPLLLLLAYITYNTINDYLHDIPSIFERKPAVENEAREYLLTKDPEETNVYYHGSSAIKGNSMYKISGSDCAHLTGNYDISSRETRNAWEAWRVVSSNRNNLTREITPFDKNIEVLADKKFREQWHKKPPIDGKFYCFPYVDNIKDYLDNKQASQTYGGITFNDGPTLIYYNPKQHNIRLPPANNKEGLPPNALWISGQYLKVKSISRCSRNKNEFCAKIDTYEAPGEHNGYRYTLLKDLTASWYAVDYRVICWKCAKLIPSPEEFQKSILFKTRMFSDMDYALDGGIMTPEKTFALKKGDASGSISRNVERWEAARELTIDQRK